MRPLIPFSHDNTTKTLRISAQATKISENEIVCAFELAGPMNQILWPSNLPTELRCDGLWQHSCFEIFFSADFHPNSKYTEINCAPNGAWNAYEFLSYRTGMISSAQTSVRLSRQELEQQRALVEFTVTSTSPLNTNCVGISAVIEFTNGAKSYWALHHPGPQADFHNKEGWRHSAFAAR